MKHRNPRSLAIQRLLNRVKLDSAGLGERPRLQPNPTGLIHPKRHPGPRMAMSQQEAITNTLAHLFGR